MFPYFSNVPLIDSLRFGSYITTARLTLYLNGKPTNFQIPVSTAQITVDRNSEFRRQGQITAEVLPTVPPPPFIPTSPAMNEPLSPFGPEVFIEMGIQGQGSGAPGSPGNPWVPLGLLTVASAELQDSGIDFILALTLYDRSWVIAQRQLLNPLILPQTPSGLLVDELQALLNPIWAQAANMPPLQWNVQPSDFVVPVATYDQGQDPWQIALDLANAAGYELFFDIYGTLTGFPTPNFSLPENQKVVFTFTDDSATALGLAAGVYPEAVGLGGGEAFASSPYTTPAACTVRFTREGVKNDCYVAAVGNQITPGEAIVGSPPPSGFANQYQGEAADLNPASPTYVHGPMGDVPLFDSVNLALTAGQAQAMAANALFMQLGSAWTITVTTPPNPLFDIDDVFAVYLPRLGLNGQKVVVDTIRHTVRYDDTLQLSGRVIWTPPAGPVGPTLTTVNFDSAASGFATAAPAKVTWSHTVAPTANALFVGVVGGNNGTGPASVTFQGLQLSEISSAQQPVGVISPVQFDAAGGPAVSSSNTGTSISWSHTCGLDASVLLVAVVGGLTANNVSSVTYTNTASGTTQDLDQVITGPQVPSDQYLYLYSLASPPPGAGTVTVTLSSANYVGGASVSYVGVSEVYNPITGTASSTTSITIYGETAEGQDWLGWFFKAGTTATNPPTTNIGVSRVGSAPWQFVVGDSNAAETANQGIAVTATGPSSGWAGMVYGLKSLAANPTTRYTGLYALANPPTGTGTVTINNVPNGSGGWELDILGGISASYIGVQLPASTTMAPTGTPTQSNQTLGSWNVASAAIANATSLPVGMSTTLGDWAAGFFRADGSKALPVGTGTARLTTTPANGNMTWLDTGGPNSRGFATLSIGQDYYSYLTSLGPVAWWKLDDAASSVTVADSSGNGYTGTVNGGVTLGEPGPGTGGTSALFDGSTGYISIPHTFALPKFSMVAWVLKPSATNYPRVFTTGNYYSSGSGFGFEADSSNWIWAVASAASANTGYLLGTALNDGKWHMVVGTFDGTNTILYEDGAQNGATTATEVQTSQTTAYIGWGGPSDGGYYSGNIAQVAIFNYALTAQQVSTLYNIAAAANIAANGVVLATKPT